MGEYKEKTSDQLSGKGAAFSDLAEERLILAKKEIERCSEQLKAIVRKAERPAEQETEASGWD